MVSTMASPGNFTVKDCALKLLIADSRATDSSTPATSLGKASSDLFGVPRLFRKFVPVLAARSLLTFLVPLRFGVP